MEAIKKKKETKIPKQARPVQTPTVLQMEAVECGAAALAIILGYYGRVVPLEKLRITCGVSRDGLKATNIMRAARLYGLQVKGYSKSVEKLKEVKTPCIIFWNFNHFLVLEGFTQNRVYLNDPAQGRYYVSPQEFDDSFTGVVITAEPSPDFKKDNEKTGLMPALAARLSNSRMAVVFILLASLFLVIPGLIIPSFTQIFIDKYLVHQMSDFVMPLLLSMGVLLILNGLIVFIQQYYLLRLETKLALTSSSKFLWHIFHLPIDFFTQRYSGEISNRVTLNDKVATLLSGDLANAVLNVIVVFFYAILLFSYDVVLTLIGIGIAALNIIALRWVSRARADGNRRLINENGKLLGTTMSGISMIETLKSSGRETDFFITWAGYFSKVLNLQQHLTWLTQQLNAIPPFLMTLNTTAIMGIGALRVMDGQMTLGMLVAFLYLMNNFIQPVNALVAIGSKLQETEADMDRIDDVLKYEVAEEFKDTEHNKKINAQSAEKLMGRLEIKNLTFGYSKVMPPLIENFSMKLEPGSRVALVGGSGSGKSTIARLVAGLYDPWEGEILFDDSPRKTLPRATLTNSVAVIDQDILLFEGTIKENLSFWDKTIEDNRIIQSAKDAVIHDVIAARPNAYDSPVAERGANFSGGQLQRMEIARALAINPSILIMDEATSALDTKSEKMIMDNVRRRGCTCLIVAHRLSTIRDADEIIVMNLGKIVERGTHTELIEKQGFYATLIST